MGFFSRLFKRPDSLLPCKQTGECPYEYEKNPDRDIEGMPFVNGDPRSCPHSGHICPEFMEDFGLTVPELNIRATIHCGGLLDLALQKGEADPDLPQYKELRMRYDEMLEQYPQSEFPQYY